MTLLERLRAINAASPFSQWAGFSPTLAEAGRAEVALKMRPDIANHAGHLHAGVIQGLIDTACGYAAGTVAGPVVASRCGVNFYAPATAGHFVARARVIKAGRRQVFAAAEIFAVNDSEEILVAGGSAVFVPLITSAKQASWPLVRRARNGQVFDGTD